VSVEPDAVEIRVVGCLLEKQRTTPEAYPLSVNALRLACNQSTNRDPVLTLGEREVLEALEQSSRRGWVRRASGAGSRARKYRQLFGEALSLREPELALLCVLMLRGAQTPGELKQRTERLHPFPGTGEVQETLDRLIERELVARLDRRPGQKEQRYRQLIGGDADADSEPRTAPAAEPAAEDRLERLERELAELRDEVGRLRQGLAGLPKRG
jgi:uncharacterized protein YceH (UPF0502 family)